MLTCKNLLYYILERFYEYEWDEAKNTKNIGKHQSLPLSDGIEVFWDKARVISEDERFNYGEKRYIAIGYADGKVLSVCFTYRRFLKRRLISVRVASRKERRRYYGKQSLRYDRQAGS
ncbi:MAG: BrnT family toxin [Fibromonadales bacterium]|nr:BrnT family toxin [Fibromonadales bacterium]